MLAIATGWLLSGCKDTQGLVVMNLEPMSLGIHGELLLFADGVNSENGWLVAREEVSTAAYCVFLNSIGYEEPPLRVVSFEINGSEGERQRLERAFLTEHADSNIQREEGRFIPVPDGGSAANCVTYYGAIAYCEWLGLRTGLPIELPSMDLWLRAASAVPDAGLKGAPGGVWEWCADWYVDGRQFESGRVALKDVDPSNLLSPRKVIVGGAYFNRGKASARDFAATNLLTGGEGEQGVGFRIFARSRLPLRSLKPPAR